MELRKQLIKSASKIARKLIKDRTFDTEKVIHALRINFPSLNNNDFYRIMAGV